MTKIAILGTCASEDWYHHQDPRQRLEVRLIPRYQQSAIVSLNSKPIELPLDIEAGLSEGEAEKLRIDFSKRFLSNLRDVKPDFLIVDLLLDSRRGVVRIADSVVTNSYILQRSSLWKTLDQSKVFNAVVEPVKYLEEFAYSVRNLSSFLKNHIPQCRIILHRARWAEYFLDERGDLYPFGPKKQVNHFVANIRIRKLEEVFEAEIQCDQISIANIPAIADKQHIWGFSGIHYQKDYYREFDRELRRILDKYATVN
ncbi:DUF6270 domain-containing protein [Aestuariivirga sp.]|jgi:hypothetical protein|uniref:DUF6270 domain-containing protein n=1 Tax=Aestuariivirga sp. TaxID=2650926 RepID=UPI003783590E